jgi:predicted membrane protein
MSVLSLILTLVIIGVVLWAVNRYIPMDHKIKSILNIVVVILVIIWLLRLFGVLGGSVPTVN